VEQIRTTLAGHTDAREDALSSLLTDLVAKRVLYEERGKYFTLAVPEHPYL
jgi:hypothetical protein